MEKAVEKAATEGTDVEQAKQTALEEVKQKIKELEEYLDDQGYQYKGYALTSAKTGEGVNKVFSLVATNLLKVKLNAEQNVKPSESIHVSSSSEQTAKPEKSGSRLWDHFKRHPKRYILGLLLAAAIAIVLTVPVIGQAVGLAGAIGFLVANTAWQLGLLAAGVALVGFAACVLGGKLIDKIKQSRSNKQERLLEQEDKRGNEQHVDAASASTKAPDILKQPIYGPPAGMGTGKTVVQPYQPGLASAPDTTGVPANPTNK
jgi:uncharacterized membrane protein YciS (DUF1049 family)